MARREKIVEDTFDLVIVTKDNTYEIANANYECDGDILVVWQDDDKQWIFSQWYVKYITAERSEDAS